MKFELKTVNENYSKSFSNVLRILSFFALLVVLCNISIKLGLISRRYQIDYNCRILFIEKSKSNFKKLSKLSNLKSKQQIWEFCREVIK